LRAPVSNVAIDNYTSAITALGVGGRLAYSVTSDIATPSSEVLRADPCTGLPQEISKLYLPWPRKQLDPRIALKAHEVTRDQTNPYDKARAIEAYLKTDFHYTLDLKPAKKDPLAEFLFDLKEGHCEYFATAMVIMLRTLDIPARIVNGFQMGEYNDLSGYYTVRESDAHSWVEVYFPKTNAWVEFDPTPSAGINDYSHGGIASSLRKYADAMEVFWLDYIVTLDRDEQASIMVDLQHRLIGVKERAFAIYASSREWLRGTAGRLFLSRRWSPLDIIAAISFSGLLAAGAVAVYVAVAHRKRRGNWPSGYGPWWHRVFILPLWKRRATRGADQRQSAVLFYERMLAIARRAGIRKHPHQTPLEFASASGVAEVRQITELYNRVRFGGLRLNEEDIRRISRLTADLRRSIRGRKRKS